MRTIFGIIFILVLSLVTLHDAHSRGLGLIGQGQAIALGSIQKVMKVGTYDGQIFNVKGLDKTAMQLKRTDRIQTAEGQALVSDEITTFFYSKVKPPINKKVPSYRDF